MLGDWGPFVLQVGVTLLVVAVLAGVVWWLVRRYAVGGMHRLGRGRVPRLAVVDAVSVDARRRLVLVRRDNLEHLLLIGGPSDIVVEQAIHRARRPAQPQQQQRPAQEMTAAPSSDTPPEGDAAQLAEEPLPALPVTTESPVHAPQAAMDNPPIPFPQPRVHVAPALSPAAHQPASQPAAERPFFPLRRSGNGAATAQTMRLEAVRPAPAEDEDKLPDLPHADVPAFDSPVAETAQTNGSAPAARPKVAAETNPYLSPAAASPEETAAKVNDLEREMARLLGEITGKR